MIQQCKNILFLMALFFPLSAFAANPAVLFVFDGSGSMWGQVDGKTKIELAKKAMSELVNDFPAGTDIGLISYGHRKEGDCSDIETLATLGSSKDSIISAVQSINPKGKTPLTKSIQIAAEQLKNRDAPTSIIVVSDGKESCNADPCAAAKAVHDAGINLKIHVVGFDVQGDEAAQLQCIAKNGGGKYFAATNATELAKSFAEVKKEVVAEVNVIEKKPEAKTIFRDDFNDDFLGEKWKMLNENLDAAILDDGKMLFINSKGDLSQDPANLLMQERLLDKTNMNVIVEFNTEIKQEVTYFSPTDYRSGIMSGILLSAGKGDFIRIFVASSYGWGGYGAGANAFVQKRSKGVDAKWFRVAVTGFKGANSPGKYRLKIEKRKYKYFAYYYNFDKDEWVKIGSYTVLGKKFKPGFMAITGNGSVESTTELDWFEIQVIE